MGNKLIALFLFWSVQVTGFCQKSETDPNKPALFSFITSIPSDAAAFSKSVLQHKNIPILTLLGAGTAGLIFKDRYITNHLHHFLIRNGVSSNESFSPFINTKILGKSTNLGKVPLNINTFFYNLGQGSLSLAIGAGFYVAGKLKKNNTALQTASQLAQSFIVMGVATQFLKLATGRQNPSETVTGSGTWHPFPSFKKFQNNKTEFDAFPSGHLATLSSTVAVLHCNYPHIKWIQPVGFTLISLVGVSMMHNEVHWASDLPLGIAMGYAYGKFIAKKNKNKQMLPGHGFY